MSLGSRKIDVRMLGFPKLATVAEASKIFDQEVNIERLQAETTLTLQALGRVLAEDIVSQKDIPPFNRSAVDGYALQAQDTFGCSQTNPVVLQVVGTSSIGSMPFVTSKRQQVVKIATGAPIPQGCDAVLMLEFTEETRANKIEVYRPVTPGENVSMQGEDVRRGELILRSGTLMRPQDVGIIAALNIPEVKVTRKPRVGVLSTGNELVGLGEDVSGGKIVDSNRPTIFAMVVSAGGQPVDLGIATDEEEDVAKKFGMGIADCDIVLASGGTSVGERDLLPSVVNSFGSPGLIVHGVAIRPGRPTALGAIHGRPVVLLPGFPVAAMIAFDVFVHPIIDRMLGVATSLPSPSVVAKALRRMPSSLGNRTFARVIVRRLEGEYVFEPLRTSGSGIISSMVRANGMVTIPENKEGIEEGEIVEVMLMRPVEV